MANDDDGQLNPQTVTTLSRLAANLSGSARVRAICLLPSLAMLMTQAERLRGGLHQEQADVERVHPQASAVARQV